MFKAIQKLFDSRVEEQTTKSTAAVENTPCPSSQGTELSTWWINAFTEEERKYISSKYDPLVMSDSNIDKAQGTITFDGPGRVKLHGLSTWFRSRKDRDIERRLLEKSESVALEEGNVEDLHRTYRWMIPHYYKDRNEDTDALEKAISACKRQIDIAPQMAQVFMKEDWFSSDNSEGEGFPEHTGFKQLAIILAKQGDFREAIRISKTALEQGWNGDWEKRIARYEKSLAKQNSKTISRTANK